MGETALKIVIADDDGPICNLLKDYLTSFKGVKVVGVASDGEKLMEIVRKSGPDAVYADIQMPGLDGLSAVLSLQKEISSLFVVFVSAHTHYAVEAFNMDAADFLAKPFTVDRVGRSLDKIKRFRDIMKGCGTGSGWSRHRTETGADSQIMLKCGHGVVMVDRESIIFIEKQGRKCIVHTSRGLYETLSSLSSIEQLLQKPRFFRCHKGYIINVQQVEKIFPYADRAYEITFHNYPHKVPMRRDKFEEFCLMVKHE